MSSFISRCPHCHANNRLPEDKISQSPTCGKCKQPLLSGAPIEGTLENFNRLIQADTPVVVDFWAPWCNPCVGFAPVFADSAKEWPTPLRFVKVDTEAQQQIGAQFAIRSIPTIKVFRQGKEIATISGALPKQQFQQWLQQALNQ